MLPSEKMSDKERERKETQRIFQDALYRGERIEEFYKRATEPRQRLAISRYESQLMQQKAAGAPLCVQCREPIEKNLQGKSDLCSFCYSLNQRYR
jgi:hypothetical protein